MAKAVMLVVVPGARGRGSYSGFWRCSWDRGARRHTTTPTSPWTLLTRDTRHCEQEIRKRTAKCNLASGCILCGYNNESVCRDYLIPWWPVPHYNGSREVLQDNPHTDLSQSDKRLCFQCIDDQECKLVLASAFVCAGACAHVCACPSANGCTCARAFTRAYACARARTLPFTTDGMRARALGWLVYSLTNRRAASPLPTLNALKVRQKQAATNCTALRLSPATLPRR